MMIPTTRQATSAPVCTLAPANEIIAQCEACGEPCKRGAVAALGVDDWVYVGDGWSDRCVARIAPRVFARDGLARYLDERGVGYEPFADLHDVARGLDAERAAA